MGIFISHAVADKAIANALVDLLQTGLDVPQKDIFCSSLESLGIEKGSNFVDFIGKKLEGAKFVIALLTPTYYERPFCLCELGATWISHQDFYPLLVPPLEFADLKAVLIGVESGSIVDKTVLNDLRDRLIAAGWTSGKTGRWEVKRDEFIKKMETISVAESKTVSSDKYKELEEKYGAAQDVIGEKNDEIANLERLVAELKKCKDHQQVAAVVKAHKADKVDECEDLIAQFKEEAKGLPGVVLEAMYHEYCGNDWSPKFAGNEEEWEAIERAKQRGFLDVDERGVTTRNHPKIKRAQEKLQNLSDFLQSEDASNSDFVNTFEEEHDYPLDPTNSDLWSDYLY
jgi:hypothetical protein